MLKIDGLNQQFATQFMLKIRSISIVAKKKKGGVPMAK